MKIIRRNTLLESCCWHLSDTNATPLSKVSVWISTTVWLTGSPPALGKRSVFKIANWRAYFMGCQPKLVLFPSLGTFRGCSLPVRKGQLWGLSLIAPLSPCWLRPMPQGAAREDLNCWHLTFTHRFISQGKFHYPFTVVPRSYRCKNRQRLFNMYFCQC